MPGLQTRSLLLKNSCFVGVLCIAAVAIVVGSGCSGSGVFSTTYQNTVAYFNTYYNAKRAFDEAVEEIRKNQPATLQTNLFALPNVPAAVRPKFSAVIEKCSKIIQFYPNSNLVDDALLLIGKSYYYLNEILPAQRKFSELLENFPRGELRFETKLMLAKTHYLAEKENDALEVLNGLITESLDENENDIAIAGRMLQGQIYMDRNDFPRAVESYKRTLEISGDKVLLALAAYQLARSYELMDNSELACQAYIQVLDFDPHFTLEFDARLRAAILYSTMGKGQLSLNMLEDLQSELLTPEQRSSIEFELGNSYRRAKEYEKALFHYETVDSLYKRTDASAKSSYQRGILFEKVFFDLQRAKVYYDKAKSEFPQSEITPSAIKKSDIFGRYVSHRTELSKYDSLLYAYLHPLLSDDHSGKLIDSVRKVGRNEIVQPESVTAAKIPKHMDSLKAKSIPIDTVHYRRSINQLALGILFFVDVERPDSSVYWLTAMLNDYPNSKSTPQALYVLSEVYRSRDEQAKVDSLYDILLSRYPNSEYAANVRKIRGQLPKPSESDSAEVHYGNAMRIHDGGNAQQAIQEFRKVARKYRNHPVNAKARYAIGWIFENVIINKDSAVAHYRLLQQEQPTSIYAERIRSKLAFLDNKEADPKPINTVKDAGVQDTTKQPIRKKLPVRDEELEPKPPEKAEPELKKDDGPDKE